jgi:hypothetical protein
MVDVGGGIEAACARMAERISAHDLRRSWNTIAGVVLGGNALLIARLDGHKASATPFTDVQAGYNVADLRAERVSAQHVADAILETAGVFPLSAEVEALFRVRGVDLAKGLTAS